jgi:hypothetical protein
MVSSRQRSLRFLLRYPRRKPPSRYKISLARAAAISFPLHAAVHAVSRRRRIIKCYLEHNKYSGHIFVLARGHEQLRSRYLEAHSTIPVSDLAIPANDMFPCFHRRGLSEVIRHMVRARFFRCIIIIIRSSNARRIMPCFNAIQPYKAPRMMLVSLSVNLSFTDA